MRSSSNQAGRQASSKGKKRKRRNEIKNDESFSPRCFSSFFFQFIFFSFIYLFIFFQFKKKIYTQQQLCIRDEQNEKRLKKVVNVFKIELRQFFFLLLPACLSRANEKGSLSVLILKFFFSRRISVVVIVIVCGTKDEEKEMRGLMRSTFKDDILIEGKQVDDCERKEFFFQCVYVPCLGFAESCCSEIY